MFFLQYPGDGIHRDILGFIKPDSAKWKSKKEEAKNLAVRVSSQALECYKNEYYDDDLYFEKQHVEKFFAALIENQVFDAGFYDFENKKIKCFCPCSRHMEKFRKLYEVNYLQGSDDCKKSKYFDTPNALMKHLQTKSNMNPHNAFLHIGIEAYLKTLYADFWCSLPGKRIGHTGLYERNSDNYKRAKKMESVDHEQCKNNKEPTKLYVIDYGPNEGKQANGVNYTKKKLH